MSGGNELNWKQILRDKYSALVCGISSFLLNMWYYCSLMEFINRFNLEEKLNHKSGLVLNGKDAFEVLKYYGYDQLIMKALIGSVLVILFSYILWNCFCKNMYDYIYYSDYNAYFWLNLAVYVLNICLTMIIFKWIIVLWLIIIIGFFYAAANSKSAS